MLLSYKKWQKINENFGVNLGVKQPNKINSLHSKWDEAGMMPMPMKSKKAKKMFGGSVSPDMGAGDEASPFMKKGKKPFPPSDDMDDMHGPDDDMDHDGDIDADDDMDQDIDHDGDIDQDDSEDLDDMDDESPGVGGPDDVVDDLPAPKKKKGSFIDKTKAVADGAKLMHTGARKMMKGMKEGAVCSTCKCANCKCDNVDDDNKDDEDGKMFSKKSKKSRKMTKEETEFFRSLQSQTGGIKFAQDDYGAWSPVDEDVVLPPTDPNANITQEDDEPGPGETGYAPQGRIGNFSEWASKYKRVKK